MGLEFAGDIPFDDVYVHSVVQAPDGRRMSKSLGTGIDPLALIDGGPRPPVFTEGGDFPAYGADAVRYGLLAMSSTQDVRFNEGTIAEGRQLANKLFNASRLVLLRVPEGVTVPAHGAGAGDRRGHVDPLAPAGRRGGVRRRDRRVRVPPREPRAVPLHLRRAVRLVPRDAQAAPVRGRQRGDRRVRPVRAGRDARARAPGDPVRDRGDLVADARRERPADEPSLARAPTRRCATSRSRRRSRGRSRPRRRCGRGARACARRPARACRRDWTRPATSAWSSTSRGSRASSSRSTATSRSPPSACPAASWP